jgi:hypothetical protein
MGYKERAWVSVSVELIAERIIRDMHPYADIIDVKYNKDNETVQFKINRGFETMEGSNVQIQNFRDDES